MAFFETITDEIRSEPDTPTLTNHSALQAATLCRQTIERGGAVMLLPGLLSQHAASLAPEDTNYLSLLLGAAHRLECAPVEGFENLLIASVSETQTQTCAASLGYAFEFNQGSEHVFRADPAYQQIDMNNATLAATDALKLQSNEAEALMLTLNQHFVSDGLRFELKNPQRWYCHFDSAVQIDTTPISVASGLDVADCRPTGRGARLWRSKLAEIEMLLFDHPVNNERQARGLLPVNTLWLWGEGQCSAQGSTVTSKNVSIVSDNFYAESLAKHIGVSHCDLQHSNGSTPPFLFALQQLTVAINSIDAYTYSIKDINSFAGAELWQRYQSGNLNDVLIWCGDSDFFCLNPPAKLGIVRWLNRLQKPKPLSAFLPALAVEEQ